VLEEYPFESVMSMVTWRVVSSDISELAFSTSITRAFDAESYVKKDVLPERDTV